MQQKHIRMGTLYPLLVQVGREYFIQMFSLSDVGDAVAYGGDEQRIHLFQQHFVCWHFSLLFDLANTGGKAREACPLCVDQVLRLRLLEGEHPSQLLWRKI